MPNQADITVLNNKANALGLTAEQIKLAHFLVLPRAIRPSGTDMAKEIGIHEATIYRWKQNRRVLSLAKELMKRYFISDSLADILEAMRVKAIQGDTAAAKLVIEYIEGFMEAKANGNNKSPVAVHIYFTEAEVKNKIVELNRKVIDI